MLHRLVNITFFFLISYSTVFSQTCSGGYFNTQAEVDAFLEDNPTCTTVNGSLYINSGTTDPVTNLNAFANITQVTSTLDIVNTQITTLGQFENASLDGVRIMDNPNLLSITLNNISQSYNIDIKTTNNATVNLNSSNISSSMQCNINCPNGVITATNNFTFINFTYINLTARKVTGFDGLQIDGSQSVYIGINSDTIMGFNNILKSRVGLSGLLNHLEGFNSFISPNNEISISTPRSTLPMLPLTLRNKYISISGCANIQDLSGIGGFNAAIQGLALSNNPRLKSLFGAENIIHTNVLEINNNDSLTILSGLNQLKSISSSLGISYNERLTNISALDNLKLLGISIINENPLLDQCCIIATLKNKNRVGQIALSNNGPNCTSIYNVLEVSCLDSDLDGIFDTTDNCDLVSNPNQMDIDGDGIGNLCDNCPNVANPNQVDTDGNGIGNACQTSTIDNVTIENGDLYIKDPQLGLIIKSIDGLCYRIKVDGSGQVMATLITCPN